MTGGEEGGRHRKVLRKIGTDKEGDLEGETGIQDGRIEMKMMTRETGAEDQIREETGVMKKRRLMKECKGGMREIVDKEGITMRGTMKIIEDMIVVEEGVMMTEEGNMKTVKGVIMIKGIIETEDQEMTLKEIENADHLGEEMMM